MTKMYPHSVTAVVMPGEAIWKEAVFKDKIVAIRENWLGSRQ